MELPAGSHEGDLSKLDTLATAAFVLQLADAIRQFGHDVAGDLRELWRRLLFSLLASNFSSAGRLWDESPTGA